MKSCELWKVTWKKNSFFGHANKDYKKNQAQSLASQPALETMMVILYGLLSAVILIAVFAF